MERLIEFLPASLLVLPYILYLFHKIREKKKQSDALATWCKAHDAWVAWRFANLGVAPSRSPKAQLIISVHHYLGAH